MSKGEIAWLWSGVRMQGGEGREITAGVSLSQAIDDLRQGDEIFFANLCNLGRDR